MENVTATPAYSAVFVFGDSLSDNGAVFALSGGTIPPTALSGTDSTGAAVDFAERGIFFDQKFTNGDVYADVSLGRLGIQGDTSTFYDDFSGSNFAVGGATATDLTTFGSTTLNSLGDQVASFQQALAALPGSEAETAAFLGGAAASVFIGLNDLGPLGDSALTATGFDEEIIGAGIATMIAEINTQTQALAAAGLGTIILNKLPSAAFFPSSNATIDTFGPTVVALFDQVSAQINAGIEGIAAGLAAAGTSVEVVDFFSLAQEVEGDKETFGFQTLENALPDSGAETTLLIPDVPIDAVGFIDPVHFTAELHEVFGAFQAKTLGSTQIVGTDLFGFHSGTAAADTIFAKGGTDLVRADAGDDLVFGGAGRDIANGDAGDDMVFGGAGNDLVAGASGHDLLSGGSGVDFLLGNAGNNALFGGGDNDALFGGALADLLVGGAGNDVMAGRGGDDIAIYMADEAGTDGDSFYGGLGMDSFLIVSDAVIEDVDAFLAARGVTLNSVENVEVLTQGELAEYDFGLLGMQLETADLFGLL